MSNVVVARNSTAEPLLLNGKLYTFERSLRNTLPWKMMPLELLLALILLANSGTKMTQQSGLEVPELLDLPRELCFLPIPHLPFSDGPFVFLFPILSSFSFFFCSSFSFFHPPLGKRTLSIKKRLIRSRWGDGIYQKKKKKKKKLGTICALHHMRLSLKLNARRQNMFRVQFLFGDTVTF